MFGGGAYPTMEIRANQVYDRLTNHRPSFSWVLRSRSPETAERYVSIRRVRRLEERHTISVDLGPSGDANESTADKADEGHTEDTEPDGQAAAELAGAHVSHSSTT